MARPWPKKSAWPYVAKSGRKSYTVGFYDHDKREHSRTFPSVRHARAWMDDYITAERRGRDSLRRFLLDLDAKEANEAEGRTIAQILELFLEVDAHPRNEEGVAPSTYTLYRSVLNCHFLGKPRHQPGNRRKLPPADYAVAVAKTQASAFNEPLAPRAWREQMREAGVPAQTRVHAWRVLSSALSWAARSPSVPEIQTNGCKLAREPVVSRRRSARRGGTGYTPDVACASAAQLGALAAGRRGDPRPDAPSRRATQGDPRAPRRDDREPAIRHGEPQPRALGTSLVLTRRRVRMGDGSPQLPGSSNNGARPSTAPNAAPPYPASCEKTSSNGGRSSHNPDALPARIDFIIPGNLTNARHGVREAETGACHLSKSQAKIWGARLLHASGASRRAAPGVRAHPWRHPVCAAPRRHLAAPTHRGPTNRRQRVRHQPEDAQRPLLIPDRGPAPTRTTTRRRRVARRTRRTSKSSFA